jgi:hypothetical protein
MDALKALADLQNHAIDDDVWPERAKLPALLPKAPAMTTELATQILPEPILNWVLDFSTRAQVPIESVAVASLGSLATLVGRKIGAFPKQHDSFWVPCVFWTAIVARPGERKSSILSHAQRPFDALEARAREKFKREGAASAAKREVLKQKIENVKDQIKLAAKSGQGPKLLGLQGDLEELLQQQECDTVGEVRYRTSDATVEKLGELLRTNPGGILTVRDELVGWLQSFDKPGREGDRAFFLEGWDSSGAPFSVDRIGRGRVVVESLCLQVMGGIQPGKLEAYIKQAIDGGGGDDGFLQRFQLMTYSEPISKVEWIDRSPDQNAYRRVEGIFLKLSEIQSPKSGEPRAGLHFSPDAQVLYREWSLALERRFRLGEDEHPAFVAHLSKFLRLMPALALLFRLIEAADQSVKAELIELHDVQRAAALCDFLEQHARKVYAIVERTELRDADALRRRIQRGDIRDGMTLREIAKKGWAPFGSNTEAIASAITCVLESFGWARIDQAHASVGRPRQVIRIHPELRRRVENE